jgi:hypothetical protein
MPNSYAEALKLPKAAMWLRAMREEHASHVHNSTFSLKLLPHSQKAIDTKWLFKLKRLASGAIDRPKARWVAKGYTQHFRINYDETAAPVICLEDL